MKIGFPSSFAPAIGLVCLAGLLQFAEAAEQAPERVQSGLLALYDFGSAEGEVVADRSGVDRPLDLEIQDMEAVRRRPGSLEIHSPTLIKSTGSANKIGNAIRVSGAITIEAWMEPAAGEADAPATLIAMAPKSGQRNFVLQQGPDGLNMRFRTNRTGAGGLPAADYAIDDRTGRLSHLVYTRDRYGRTRIFVDGKQVIEEHVAGSTDGWELFPLTLANELDGESPWLGTLHLVAIYRRDLQPQEVEQNFRVGAGFRAPERSDEHQELSSADLFEAKIAPLLSSRCVECHNSVSSSGGLDLSNEAAAFAEGPNGAALVAGDAAASRLIEMVEKNKMPLGRPSLLKGEKALLREWVDGGAPWTIDQLRPSVRVEPDKVSRAWIQRLTVPEYVASVRSSFGVDITNEAAEILPPDHRSDGFKNTAYTLNVDLGHVAAYARLAQVVVGRLDVEEFARRFSDSQELSKEALEKLIVNMGGAILRGPLEEEELAMYQGLAGAVMSAEGGFGEVVGYLLEAMLQSPRFLYRVELERGDGTVWPAAAHELAARLSYILWGAPPDDALMAAARTGTLHDPAVFDQHLRRMLADARTIERSTQFISEWLDLDRLDSMQPNKEKFPKWTAELASDMRDETVEFFREVVWKEKRPVTHLLNAQVTYATPRLAAHYGLAPHGDGLARYDLSSTPSRGGLLTQGSVLTIGGEEASMVTRGLFVLKELLNDEVGNPPPGLDTTPPPTSPGRSNRAISMERVKSPACGGCHSRFEPLAFGMEKFDGLGAYQEVDHHGNALNENGEVLFPDASAPVEYNVASEMMDLLANSERVEQTLIRKMTQFALGRPLVAEDDEAIQWIHQQAKRDGLTYTAVLAAIVKSDLIRMTRTEI